MTRAIVLRLWARFHLRRERHLREHGGRREPNAKPWRQGNTLTPPTTHRAWFRDLFRAFRLDARRPW